MLVEKLLLILIFIFYGKYCNSTESYMPFCYNLIFAIKLFYCKLLAVQIDKH